MTVNINLEFLENFMPLGFVGWGFLVFIIIIYLVTWWSLTAPGFRGIALGVHIIHSYTAGGKLFSSIRGNLVDLTHINLSSIIARKLKNEVLIDGLKRDLEATSDVNRRQMLQNTLTNLERLDLQRTVKIYGVRRTRTFTKHLFIVFFPSAEEYEQFPENYVSKTPNPGFNIFALDWLNKGLLQFHTLPLGKMKVADMSRVYVHAAFPVKLPTLTAKTVEEKYPEFEAFTKVVAYTKDSVAYRDQQKRMNETIRGMQKLQQQDRRKDIIYSTIIRNQEKALIHLHPEVNPKKMLAALNPPRKEPALGAIVGLLLGGFLAETGGFSPIIGAFIGAVLGLLVMAKLER